jgi:hypothetical protein
MMSEQVDYKSCALSAYRAKLAYLWPIDMENAWKKVYDEKSILYSIFNDVLDAPKSYSDTITGAFAYSWIQGTTLHFIFRGTEDFNDVKVDLKHTRDYLFPGNKKVLVHSGFLGQFRAISDELLKTILEIKTPITAVYFSGHSLGGGLATIAAGFYSPIIRETLKCRIICHTIGSPRVGNTEFVNWWIDKVDESCRILNFADPVVLLPINGYYKHINNGIQLNDNGTVTFIKDDHSWLRRLYHLPSQVSCSNIVQNHFTDIYINRLLRLANWGN